MIPPAEVKAYLKLVMPIFYIEEYKLSLDDHTRQPDRFAITLQSLEIAFYLLRHQLSALFEKFIVSWYLTIK